MISWFLVQAKKVKSVYDWVYNPFLRKGLPAKPSKCKHSIRDPLTIFGVVVYKDGNIGPDIEMINKVLDATAHFGKWLVWDTAKLQHVLGWRNCSLLLSRPAMAISQEILWLCKQCDIGSLCNIEGEAWITGANVLCAAVLRLDEP